MDLDRVLEGDSFYPHHPIPDRKRWERIFLRLYDLLELSPYDSFECDVFEIFPDYDLDCDCGWDSHPFWDWLDRLQHREDCFQQVWQQFERCYGSLPYGDKHSRELYRQKLEEIIKPVYQQLGWSTEGDDWWRGVAIKCSCDYHQRVEQKLREIIEQEGYAGHRRGCVRIKPNFWYKPDDWCLWWYKYPLRSAECSEVIPDERLEQIVRHCIDFVKGQR
ncbi:hypothetical protein HRbin16_01694 [bacterium HR16]|nr:hypothetical protein HRbin16_01694 [bacterium HR16]